MLRYFEKFGKTLTGLEGFCWTATMHRAGPVPLTTDVEACKFDHPPASGSLVGIRELYHRQWGREGRNVGYQKVYCYCVGRRRRMADWTGKLRQLPPTSHVHPLGEHRCTATELLKQCYELLLSAVHMRRGYCMQILGDSPHPLHIMCVLQLFFGAKCGLLLGPQRSRGFTATAITNRLYPHILGALLFRCI